jgi:hypothetical protein
VLTPKGDIGAAEMTMIRIGTVLIAATIAGGSLPALGQPNNGNNLALDNCLRAADQKYQGTWQVLCEKSGSKGHCVDFVGSPRDKEFSQLRIEEQTLCLKLYGK